MWKMYKYLALTVIVLLMAASLTGCGGSRENVRDEPTEFMVWQFAQGVVRSRVPRPNHAVFPRYSRDYIVKQENNKFVVTAYVTTQDDSNNSISFDFTVEAKYAGNDIFEELTVDIKRSKQ